MIWGVTAGQFLKQSSGTGLSHKTTTSLKASLLGELDDMIQSVSGKAMQAKHNLISSKYQKYHREARKY